MIPETFDRLRNSDRAVSPVIGVILMVAITVILAAVIAAFVLGFGAGADAAPQASIDVDVVDDETVTLEHLSGEAIDPENLRLGGAVDNDSISDEFGDDFAGGDIVEITLNETLDSGDTVNLVWDSGEESSVLASGEY